jgi:hypothetical protein
VGSQAGAQLLNFGGSTPLSGANENPANASPGTGAVLVTVDLGANTLRVQAHFSGLLGTTIASHIHCCLAVPFSLTTNAGVATTTPSFVGFPLGVTAGAFDRTYDLGAASTYRAGFITANGGTVAGAEAALLAGLNTPGATYYNIHTNVFTGGEIKAFLVPTAVPEPSTYALMTSGLLVLGGAAWRRRRA